MGSCAWPWPVLAASFPDDEAMAADRPSVAAQFWPPSGLGDIAPRGNIRAAWPGQAFCRNEDRSATTAGPDDAGAPRGAPAAFSEDRCRLLTLVALDLLLDLP